jgi:hypothetical protein
MPAMARNNLRRWPSKDTKFFYILIRQVGKDTEIYCVSDWLNAAEHSASPNSIHLKGASQWMKPGNPTPFA